MMKNIIISFDGTGNEPSDAQQHHNQFGLGELEDNSISNVLKLHLMFGGDLSDRSHFSDQKCFYYSGVGTYGKRFKRAFNAGLGLQNLDVTRIQEAAKKDLKQNYQQGDKIFIFGFSRGAAIARQFAATIIPEIITDQSKPIKFLGVFDTVASIGIPNLKKNDIPVSDVVFEDMYISESIKKALHLLSLDEKRKAFLPTLMNAESRVTEIWFAGAHSDIGGGYRKDGLSDITLEFMLDYLRDENMGLKFYEPVQLDYENLLPPEAEFKIDYSDVMINSNPFGQSHQQKRPVITSLITLCNRPLQVMDNDEASKQLPILHHTVADRIYGDPDYKPQSLVHVPHRIRAQNGELSDAFDGLREHKLLGRSPLIVLHPGEKKKVRVHSGRFYNNSNIMLKKGHKYSFVIDINQNWYDSEITTNARGWDVKNTNLDFKLIQKIFIRLKENNRRVPKANWFEICAAVGETEQELFKVLDFLSENEKTFEPSSDGEFCPFANDLKNRYSNNLGFIDIFIHCESVIPHQVL